MNDILEKQTREVRGFQDWNFKWVVMGGFIRL